MGARRGRRRADRAGAPSRAGSRSSTPPTSTTAARARCVTGRVLAEAPEPRGAGRRDEGVHADDAGRERRGLSRKHILASIDASLRRLGLDYVDLYQIHRWDPTTPIEETMEALHDVVQGRQGALHRREQHVRLAVREGAGVAERHGWTRFVSMQNHYNLVYREEEREMIPQCLDQGVAVIPWSPLARGLLAGQPHPRGREADDARRDRPVRRLALHARRRLRRRRPRGRGRRRARRARARRWRSPGCCSKPGVTAPIVGATKVAPPRGRARRRAARARRRTRSRGSRSRTCRTPSPGTDAPRRRPRISQVQPSWTYLDRPVGARVPGSSRRRVDDVPPVLVVVEGGQPVGVVRARRRRASRWPCSSTTRRT